MPEFEIRSIPRQPIAAIRLSSTTDEIGETMGRAFGTLFGALGRRGVEPAGMPLTRYFSFGGPTIEYECAVPVATPFPGDGDVQPGEIGGGDAVFAVHVGPYDTIGQTWEAAMAWMQAQGRQPAGPGWESYIDDPQNVEAANLRTEIFLPVA